ncbi:hypothetical protein QBC41DRAFT_317970 [Cercophora samala]|uniref:Secreted protein n=1 Tax=Cercophora samala TaxID=330535 RepID=A0AA39ZG04_9PEZI|nr:hypothetical protein QBC41DRAFT_317970 [Cercophora samala]
MQFWVFFCIFLMMLNSKILFEEEWGCCPAFMHLESMWKRTEVFGNSKAWGFFLGTKNYPSAKRVREVAQSCTH